MLLRFALPHTDSPLLRRCALCRTARCVALYVAGMCELQRLPCWPGTHLLPLMPRRDCWAPRPEDRPSFDQVVGRLRRLLADTAGG